MNPSFNDFRKHITNPVKFRLFMFANVPSAFFAGVKVDRFTENESVISIKQKWFNKNPFRSIYFAILTMAAEVSTGVLCMAHIYKRDPAVSMLVVKSEAFFFKKATGKISFTCANGKEISLAVDEATATGEGRTVICHSVGRNAESDIVAEFYFTWSFKSRTPK